MAQKVTVFSSNHVIGSKLQGFKAERLKVAHRLREREG